MRTTLLVLTLLLAGCLGPGFASTADADAGDETPAANADEPIVGRTHLAGYLQVRDGTLLAWDAFLPGDGSASYPTLLTYDGYAAGGSVDSGYADRYVPQGYALIGVNVRGTGCSGGHFDFFEPVQALDGYDAIEWAAAQEWSDGRVGMIGKSYPGITQLFTAAAQPPHLVAAAPGHVYGDIYRDVAYPGGIFNYAFAGLWSFVAQPLPGTITIANSVSEGDAVCAQHVAERAALNARYNPFVQAQEHPYDDALMVERSPSYLSGDITVPLFLVQAWQDEQVGVRGVDVVEELPATTPFYLTLSNGDHSMYRTATSLERLDRFFDHYVKGLDNGFEKEAPVQVWWDADVTTRAPAWTSNHTAWPITDGIAPLRLDLAADGRLLENASAADTAGAAQSYVYPAGTTSNGAGYGFGWPAEQTTDKLRAPAPARATWQTAALSDDLVLLGAANLTLALTSTAVDTDVQITVSEVRPDGAVVFVQHGWLRASHRALDGERSSTFRPYHPHSAAAAELLTPGQAAELAIEIFPAGHTFRAGSALRLDIEAPEIPPELWGFAHHPTPALNTILGGSLVMPTLAEAHAPTPLPACGSLIRQSCVTSGGD